MSMANQQEMTASLTDRPPSVGRMFFDRVEKTPDRPAYSFPVGDSWTTITWRESSDRVARIAAGLISLGVAPEERVAIACSTRFEWVLADLAIMSAGAATTTAQSLLTKLTVRSEAGTSTYVRRAFRRSEHVGAKAVP